MTLCPKCIIGGILQNGAMLEFDGLVDAVDGLHVGFQFSLLTDDKESRGTRDVRFDGSVTEGTLIDGLLTGTLSGQFDVFTTNSLSAPAQLETFSRRGLLNFLVVTVRDADNRTSFSANLRPTTMSIDPRVALRELQGTVFLGWDDPTRAAEFGD